MAKIVTAHQPNYLPWIGLFSKIELSDCFVVADTFALGDQSTINRNKIRTNNGWGYLTIPLNHNARGIRICDITLPIDKTWRNIHWRSIYTNYVRTDFFKDHKDFFEELYQRDLKYLWQLNLEIILYLLKCFNIEVEVAKASDLDLDPSSAATDFIISFLKKVRADIYLSGPSGRDYMSLEKFSQHNIDLKYFKLEHPVYKQRYPGFEPNMSAIDLLFNTGPQAGEIIRKSGSIID